ncbi:hypothetical protein NDU88_007947 [Pleurodeles waltl]|uniref:Uncharacterized protein n=1 Tax=Pleurodeles waltl TaxID=8319 RepID=A0AAV7RTT4_PLEWA|nr:hypothetical protein NDU88_007947 [Pleurodeles waltl]
MAHRTLIIPALQEGGLRVSLQPGSLEGFPSSLVHLVSTCGRGWCGALQPLRSNSRRSGAISRKLLATTAVGKDKTAGNHATNTKTQYTTLRHPTQMITCQMGATETANLQEEPTEPSSAELLVAIRGSGSALKCKIEPVSRDMNLLQADLRKVADEESGAETNIEDLHSEVKDPYMAYGTDEDGDNGAD